MMRSACAAMRTQLCVRSFACPAHAVEETHLAISATGHTYHSLVQLFSTGQAIRYHEKGDVNTLKLETVTFRELEEHEVLVKVQACGVCYRDILDRTGAYPFLQLPMTPGHEVAGTIVRVGPSVTKWSTGDRVINRHHSNCGKCELCKAGGPKCEQTDYFYAVLVPGGYAEYIICHEYSLVMLPKDIPFEKGCFLICTAAVAMRAFRHANLAAGERVLITGASGGVGIHAVQVARALGAHVTAITTSASKVPLLKKYGAHEVVCVPQSSPNFTKEVEPVDVVLELVGSKTFPFSLRSLKFMGRCVFVGNLDLAKVEVNPGFLIMKEVKVMGSSEASEKDIADIIDMVQKKQVELVLEKTLPLAEAVQAQTIVATKGVCGRLVLIPPRSHSHSHSNL